MAKLQPENGTEEMPTNHLSDTEVLNDDELDELVALHEAHVKSLLTQQEGK